MKNRQNKFIVLLFMNELFPFSASEEVFVQPRIIKFPSEKQRLSGAKVRKQYRRLRYAWHEKFKYSGK